MKIIRKVLEIGVLVSTLTGCSEPINSGLVLEKRYEPQEEYTRRGGTMLRHRRTMVDDENFIITFGRNEQGKPRTRIVYVKKDLYDSLKVGDSFDICRFSYEDSDPGYRKS